MNCVLSISMFVYVGQHVSYKERPPSRIFTLFEMLVRQ
jgi:hypothetical protein